MANVEINGLIQTTAMLDALSKLPAESAQRLLFKGGDILVRRIKAAAGRHVNTGAMQRSIKYKPKVQVDKNGAKYITVTATGTERRKTQNMSNAQKAFWANYGTSKQPGTRFWTNAEKAAEKEMQPVFDAEMGRIFLQKGIK